MASSARIFLFYGPDSRSSQQALRQWEELFLKKYGQATRYLLEGDELDQDSLLRQLSACLEGQSLFELPKLIVLKRLSAQERKPSYASSKAVAALLDRQGQAIDASVTVAVWEGKDLPAGHPLLVQFQTWQAAGRAEIRHFSLPEPRSLGRTIASRLAARGVKAEAEAAAWLADQYAALERQQRQAARLKGRDLLLEDGRGWWLHGVLEQAALRAKDGRLSLADLRAGTEEAVEPVNAFDLASALTEGRFELARQLLARLEQGQEGDSAYFSLYAALRWQLGQGRGRLAGPIRTYLGRLLAEAEVVAKNYPLRQAWLADLLLCRLERACREGEMLPLLPPRQLWLAQLRRS